MTQTQPMDFATAVEDAALAGALERENLRLIGLVKNQRALSRRVEDSRQEIRRLAATLRLLEQRT